MTCQTFLVVFKLKHFHFTGYLYIYQRCANCHLLKFLYTIIKLQLVIYRLLKFNRIFMDIPKVHVSEFLFPSIFRRALYVSDRHSKAQITNHSLRINLLYLTALWRSHFYLTLSKATWTFVITWHLLTFHIWIYRRSSIMIAHFILIHRCQPLRFFRNFYEFRAKVTVLLSTVYLLRIFDYCQPGTVPHLNIIVII